MTRLHKIINTGDYLLFMLRVREIVEELRVFERSKAPFEVKCLLRLRFWVLQPIFRRLLWGRTARILSLSFIQSLKPLFGTGEFGEKLPACIREEYLNSIGRKSC